MAETKWYLIGYKHFKDIRKDLKLAYKGQIMSNKVSLFVVSKSVSKEDKEHNKLDKSTERQNSDSSSESK